MPNRVIKWLAPGLGVKRWLFLILGGIVAVLFSGRLLWDWRLLGPCEVRMLNFFRFLVGDSELRTLGGGLLFLGVGLGAVAYGARGALSAVTKVFLPEQEDRLIDLLYEQKLLSQAPRLVVIGGGTGMPVLLRGLKDLTSNITAIVTVADDGGSSGRLRGEMGILPPGDIRNCLTALATAEPMLEKLFQYRFNTDSKLNGHSFGNLFIAAMSEITGDFEAAVRESSRVLAVRGRVLPVSLESLMLCAELSSGEVVCGESNIAGANEPILRVFTVPEAATPLPDALTAIKEADAIVLGPGSLYTSIIPNLLVAGIADAIAESEAQKIYVVNVMTQPGETTGYTASDHAEAIFAHSRPDLFDTILVNTGALEPQVLERYRAEGAEPVVVDETALKKKGLRVVKEDMLRQTGVVRHSSKRLGRAVFRLVLSKQLRTEGGKWRGRLASKH